MGLDLYFNRQAAVDAGLVLSVERNGTDEDIALSHGVSDDPEYTAWLEASQEVVAVPGTDMYVANDGIDDRIAIRANKWGRVYEPMTNWLRANNIEWSEF